jgi:hypothetical protein
MIGRTVLGSTVLVAVGAVAGWLAAGGQLPVTAQAQAKADQPATSDRVPSLQQLAADGRKPNISLVDMDNFGWGELGCFGAGNLREAPTPRIDKLASDGVRLPNNGFRYYNAFGPRWYPNHPGAWVAAGWIAGSAWTAATWGACTSTVGYVDAAVPYTYDYGNNITYQDGTVYYDDQPYASEQQYADQAAQIATAGQQASPAADDKWQPLGVIAMVKGDETTSNDIFQLALNKDGVVRGNYYNAVTDAVTPVTGSLDKKSQRVAWTIGDKKDTVYEAGLLNLTQEQTTMLVHYGEDSTEEYSLFRIEQPQQENPAPPK